MELSNTENKKANSEVSTEYKTFYINVEKILEDLFMKSNIIKPSCVLEDLFKEIKIFLLSIIEYLPEVKTLLIEYIINKFDNIEKKLIFHQS